MNEFERRGIEKFFRSKLKHIDSQTGDWSTPPDFIFTNAIDAIEQNKKSKRRRRLIVFFLFTGIALLSSIIIFQTHSINDAHAPLNKQNNSIINQRIATDDNKPKSSLNNSVNGSNPIQPENKGQTSSIQSQTVANTPLAARSSFTNQHDKPSAMANSDNQKITNVFTNYQTQINEQDSPHKQLTDSHSWQFGSSQTSPATATQNTNENSHINSNLLKKNESLVDGNTESKNALLSFPELYQFETQYLPIAVENITKTPVFAAFSPQEQSANGFEFSINSGINLSSFNMKDVVDPAYENLVNYDKSCAGYFINTGLHYAINNKWSGGLVFQFNSINNNSQYNQNAAIEQGNMSIVNNQREYAMPMEIVTPLGTHILNSKILFEEDELISNLISSNSDISQHLNTYGLGISLRYSAIRNKKLHSYLGLNLSHNYIHVLNSGFETTIMMDGKLKKQFNTNPQDMAKVYKNYTTVLAEFGLDYAVSKRLHVGISSSIGRSLNSLTRTENDTYPKTYLQYFTAGVGAKYNLTSKN